ncbi:MAG: hypothetical protein AAGJ85_02685 [Pseudomonadota bacterium]
MAGHNNGFASAMKEEKGERTRAWVREVALWSMVSDTNNSKALLIRDVEKWMAATGRARQQAMEAIRREKEKTAEAYAEAERKLTELLNAAQSSEWAGTPVDPIIICRMRGDADCGGDTAGGAAGDDDLGVRERATGAD